MSLKCVTTKLYYIECDECGEKSMGDPIRRTAVLSAIMEGWQREDGKDFCDACWAEMQREKRESQSGSQEDGHMIEPIYGGKTIYINEKTGDDAHDGLTPETALLTREEVASRATPSKPTVFVVVWDGEKWRTEKEQSNG